MAENPNENNMKTSVILHVNDKNKETHRSIADLGRAAGKHQPGEYDPLDDMAMAGGVRAFGGDGYDFEHRQKIAAHYRMGVVYKTRLKNIFVVHGMLAFLIFLKLFDDIFYYHIGFNIGPLRSLNMPEGVFWEYWWFTSLASIALALRALPKNKELELTYAYYSMFVLGVVPLAIGIGSMLPEFFSYLFDDDDVLDEDLPLFAGRYPMCIIWFIWFFITAQMHAFAMYTSLQLIKLWRRLNPQEKIQLAKKDE